MAREVSREAHERAVQRAIQAGAVPMTTLQVLLEWQRDWARSETHDGCIGILRDCLEVAQDAGVTIGQTAVSGR